MLPSRTIHKVTEFGFALTAIATLILAGCGGGGSSATSSGTTAAATTTTTVTPFKGRFTSGSVTLVDANGDTVTLSAGGSINASGVASVTYPANVTYPLTVKVAGTYLDETNNNTPATLALGSPLQGLIPSTSAAASGVPVTAVTHVARSMLPASGFSAASAVAAITGAANSVLGIASYSQAMLPPVFNAQGQTSDPTTIKLAALANVIGQQGAGADLGAKLHDIATKLAAGSAVNAVIPQATFDAALAAVNQIGGASGVVPASAVVPSIPAFALPGAGLNAQITALIPTCAAGQVLQLTASGLSCVSGGTVAPTPSITGFSPTTGAVGTSVTITGTNLVLGFPSAPTVKFGTTNAGGPYTNVSNTGITFTVPAGLAAGTHIITIGGMSGTPVTVGTFTVTAGAGGVASAFPNEAITLPTTSRNAITTPTIAATDLSTVVGTFTGTTASYETNVLASNYTTGTTLNSCALTFAANRTVTLTSGAHTYTQVLDGTNTDSWSPALTVGQVNTGSLHAGPQTQGPGITVINITIGRGKVLSVTADIVADPFTPFTPMTERLTCWMPINRTVSTAGASWTQWLSYGSASDMPTTITGTYAGSLFSANNALAPAGATCQLVVATDGTATFSTTGATTDVSFSAQIAGDREDRVGYTDANNWDLRAKDINNQIDGTYNVITLQNVAGTLTLTSGQGTVRPLTSVGYACMNVVKQ